MTVQLLMKCLFLFSSLSFQVSSTTVVSTHQIAEWTMSYQHQQRSRRSIELDKQVGGREEEEMDQQNYCCMDSNTEEELNGME